MSINNHDPSSSSSQAKRNIVTGGLAGTLLAQQVFWEIGNLNAKSFYFTRDAYWINALVFDTKASSGNKLPRPKLISPIDVV